jgi:hypothetical protein
MSYADPQSVTISGSANSLPRVSSGDKNGAFQKEDATVRLSIAHSKSGSKSRRLARLDHSKIATDPFVAGNSITVGMGCYLVVETPPQGYTPAEAKAVVDGFVAWLSASTGANVTRLLGGEQ